MCEDLCAAAALSVCQRHRPCVNAHTIHTHTHTRSNLLLVSACLPSVLPADIRICCVTCWLAVLRVCAQTRPIAPGPGTRTRERTFAHSSHLSRRRHRRLSNPQRSLLAATHSKLPHKFVGSVSLIATVTVHTLTHTHIPIQTPISLVLRRAFSARPQCQSAPPSTPPAITCDSIASATKREQLFEARSHTHSVPVVLLLFWFCVLFVITRDTTTASNTKDIRRCSLPRSRSQSHKGIIGRLCVHHN